jgi:hypothetical protein
MHSKNNNNTDLYRGIIELQRVYQHRSNIVKDNIGGLQADSHSTLNRRKNYVYEIWKLHGASNICQAETHSRVVKIVSYSF